MAAPKEAKRGTDHQPAAQGGGGPSEREEGQASVPGAGTARSAVLAVSPCLVPTCSNGRKTGSNCGNCLYASQTATTHGPAVPATTRVALSTRTKIRSTIPFAYWKFRRAVNKPSSGCPQCQLSRGSPSRQHDWAALLSTPSEPVQVCYEVRLSLELSRFRGRVNTEVFTTSLARGRGKLPPRSGGVKNRA